MTGTSSPTATADNGRSSLGGTTMRFDGRAGSGTGDGVCKRVRDFFGSNSAFESKKTTVTTSRFWILIAFALFAAGYICGDIQLGAYDSHNLATVTKEDVLQIVTVAKEDVLQIVQQHARYSNQDHNMPTLTKADVLQMIKQHSSRDVSTPTTKQMLEVVPFTGSNFTSKKFDSQGLQIELQLTMSKIVLLLAFCFVAGVYLGSCLQPTLLQNLNRASTLPKDDTLDVAQPCLPETNVPPLTKDNVCQIVQICIDGANVSTLTTNDVVDVFNHCFQEAKISTITKEDIIEIVKQNSKDVKMPTLPIKETLNVHGTHPSTKQATMPNYPFLWKNANSPTLENSSGWKSDYFDVDPFVLGHKYQWTVYTVATKEEQTAPVWLGVKKSTQTLRPTGLFGGDQKGCWGVYGYLGCERSEGAMGSSLGAAAKFGKASNVTLTLDLSEGNADNGSLSICVNGGATIVAVSDMRAHLEGSNVIGYQPAVSCSRASAKILSIEAV